jgi:hypothetical protein
MRRHSVVARPTAKTEGPAPLPPPAFYGLAGEIVHAIEPQTEGHPAALLLQFLAAFGFAVGRGPFYQVEADRHHANLFVVLVGDTAKSRKGTTWGWVSRLFESVKGWPADRVKTGLSSGEGFIEQVSGCADNRLLVTEGEFASVLQMLMRTGNTLSAQLRNAWDGKPLSILTKRAPANAPDGHISFIGHITADEVHRLMTANEMGNGFANRFLWCHVQRARVLPDGGRLADATLSPFASQLSRILAWARKQKCQLSFDDAAHTRWCEGYEALSQGMPGLCGAIISRAEAQVVRLSLVYALLDKSKTIRTEQLEAALAVWDYCEASARHVFGDALGDPTADEILTALRRSPAGMSRTDISNHFKHHRSQAQIDGALALLESRGFARKQVFETRGRPIERWSEAKQAQKAN